VKSVAEGMRLAFRRIQFTPDLVPSDITGSEVMEEARGAGTRAFRFVEGPVFANVVLADEINRAPPRTQAALLEAMQEHAVSAAGRTMPLPEPFFVLATQNPIEQEGTYPLPEAQLDRFLFDVRVGYPAADDEVAILRATTGAAPAPLEPVLGADETLALQRLARMVAAGEPVLRYAAALVRATRPGDAGAPPWCAGRCGGGAGPRAGQGLVLGAKAHALLAGRYAVTPEDVRRVAAPVLRHRVLPTFAAEAEGIDGGAGGAAVLERWRRRVRGRGVSVPGGATGTRAMVGRRPRPRGRGRGRSRAPPRRARS
jgi:MoxR-like ATPase